MKIRPSAIARIAACPGSLRASQGSPDWLDEYGDNTVREQGTAGHWAAERLAAGHSVALGTVAPNGVAITEDLFSGAESYLSAVKGIGCSAIAYEYKVQIPDISANCEGTADAAGHGMGLQRPFIFVGDLKLGYRVVNVWPNYQLISYAAGVARALGWRLADIDVRFMIAQPRKWHRVGYIRHATVSGEMVQERVNWLREVVAIAESDSPPLTPGEHCEYCPARQRCEAASHAAGSFSIDMTNDLTTAEAERELAMLLERKAIVEARITGLSAQIEHAARNGQRLQMFETERKQGYLTWNAEASDSVRALSRVMGGALEKQPELITPTQAKKLLPAAVVDSYAHRPQGAFKLVRQDPSKWVEIFKGN